MAQCVFDWLSWALAGNAVWDIGQLHPSDCKILNQAVKLGKLKKARASWAFISRLKTVWYHEDNPPQEVMAQFFLD